MTQESSGEIIRAKRPISYLDCLTYMAAPKNGYKYLPDPSPEVSLRKLKSHVKELEARVAELEKTTKPSIIVKPTAEELKKYGGK